MNLRCKQPIAYLITEGRATDAEFAISARRIIHTIQTAVKAGVSMVQIREKNLSTRLLFELVKTAAEITVNTETSLLVNDRADVALAAKADGVHLASKSLSAAVVREFFPERFIIGVSTHSWTEIENAAASGADFAVFGPIFTTPQKGTPAGLESLRKISVAAAPFPVIGLGGVDENNCEAVIDAGASGIAAIRSLNDAGSIKSIIDKLRR